MLGDGAPSVVLGDLREERQGGVELDLESVLVGRSGTEINKVPEVSSAFCKGEVYYKKVGLNFG